MDSLTRFSVYVHMAAVGLVLTAPAVLRTLPYLYRSDIRLHVHNVPC